ncbi:MAG: DNA internalization-related competence protein ComEC/Rec2 [Ramlibacter sp.]|nr:DNA internalization-related competence protein ComEC/Rec2 [Ramlibacter sp.]
MPNNHQRAGGWITPALLGAVVGTAVQLHQPALWDGAAYALLAAAAVGTLFFARSPRHRWVTGPAAVLLAIAAAAFAVAGLRACAFAAQALDPAMEGRDVTVVGIVAAMPQRNETGVRFRLRVESASVGGAPVRLVPQLYLGWYGGATTADGGGRLELQRQAPDLRAGERWQMNVRLKAPHGNSNPHGFDYELWLWDQGLQATGYVRAGLHDPAPRRIAPTGLHPVERARQAVRDAVFEQVPERRTAGLLAALIVGDQNAIDRADWDIFRATGVAHLMSISGLHVTMFAWAAAALVGTLWRRSGRLCLAWPAQHAALVGGMALAAGYALFSGWGVPAQRTVWMLAAVGLLRLSGRHWPWPQVWLLACAVVVTVDPWSLLQPGFWLSFVAVGVLFATDAGPGAAQASGHARRFSASVGAMFREQWVVTLALTPLTLLFFGQVSLVGLLANALAIPWVTLVITPVAMAGVALAPLWQVAAWAIGVLEAYLHALAALPFATVSMPAPPLWAGAVGVFGGLLLAMRLPWQVRLLGLPLLVPVLFWQAPRPDAGQFELLAADVGQGNAVIVRTAAHTLVYDSGPRYSPESDAGHRVLVPLLRALDERVDTLMLSHRDSDHTGGARAVLAMQPQAVLLSSIEDGHELQAVRPSRRCAAGQHWHWDGVDFDVLHPATGDYQGANKSNAMSCVLRIGNGTHTVLLAGDIEQAQEAKLVQQGADLKADLLLVPHHGSKTSSSELFLDAVQPSLALVQSGYRNRFGHPATPVLERYHARAIAVADSPRCGAARWRSDQASRVMCERQMAPRYWHHRIAP